MRLGERAKRGLAIEPGGRDETRHRLAGDLLNEVASIIHTLRRSHFVQPQKLPFPGGHAARLETGDDGDRFLHAACEGLAVRFNIGHATLQVETDAAHACRLAPAEVV